MRSPKPFPEEFVVQLSTVSTQCKTAAEYRRFQCVWLRVQCDMKAEEIAIVVQMNPRSVKRIQERFADNGVSIFTDAGHGGRYHENLTKEQEEAFLQPFLKPAEAGKILTVNQIHAEYEQLVGHVVPKSTVYRMLARHGWRKIAPRPRHPKANVTAQDTLKKTLER